MGALRISTEELRAFARAAARADTGAAAGLKTGVRAAGDLVAAEVRARSGWSARIPGSVTVKARGPVAIVSAGGDAAPNAAPLENRGRSGLFRHPVNAWAHQDRGEWRWGKQAARPFLAPAVEATADAAAEVIIDAVDRGLLEVIL